MKEENMMKEDREGLRAWEERFAAWLRQNLDLSDGSHDLGHFRRVWKTADFINREEGSAADPLVLLASAYFHDLVSLPKNHPERSSSSRLSAEKTALLLSTDFPDFPVSKIEAVKHAIHAHSFSAGIEPRSTEARILQDADRLEAVGAIGLARVFYTAGQLDTRLFHEDDPLGKDRLLNDKQYALDHFKVKLLKLPAMMHTVAGRKMGELNARYLEAYLQKIERELSGEWGEEMEKD
jgi:uncharacterized protein